MLSLFKLKKKSKKAKDQNPDDEKENTSSPTKVKKVEKTPSSAKESGKKKSKVLNENKKQDETENNNKKSATLPTSTSSNVKSGNVDKLNTIGLDAPYQNSGSNTKPLIVDVTTTPILASSTKSPKQHTASKTVVVASEPSPISAGATSSGGSDGTNEVPVTPANTGNAARVPVLSASDAVNSSSFVRGNFLSSTISGSDLNRYLNSGYMHSGDSYLQKPVDPKYAKSPHFHRPPNFSFYRNAGPNYVITPRRNANRVSSSSMSSNARSSRVGQTMGSMSTAKRVRSNSPVGTKHEEEQAVSAASTAVKSDEQSTVEPSAQQAGEEPVTKINIDNEEPIRLSKFSGGYEPDPHTPRKIESLDWPAPPYPAAVPELRARSRSSSNRYGHSTVYSVDGADQCLDDSDQDEDEEEVNLEVTATTTAGQLNQSAVSNTSSVATSGKRPKSRPTPKYQYRHGFFDNDYDDYLLQYKPRSEWRKHLERHKQISGLVTEDVTNNKSTTAEVEVVEEDVEPAEKLAQEKLKKEIDEIAKLENESSMAADLIKEIKAEQKMAHRKLKLDPWKASRTPSAKAEPPVRTRFDSPVNASPSRIFYYNMAGSHRIPNTPSGHTISTTTPGTAGFLHSSTTASTSFFSGTGGGAQSAGSNSSTLIASGSGGHGGVAVTSSSSNNAITNAQSINYNLDSSATSSAALMASPSSPPPKSATLPVTASSTSSSAQQHYSGYSSSSAASSSHRANTLSQASTSPTITANGTPKAGMTNIVYNIAGSRA